MRLVFGLLLLSLGITMSHEAFAGQIKPPDNAAVVRDDNQLLEQWNAVGRKRAYQLRVANRLWGQKGYPIRPKFLALTCQQYGAEMLLVEFAQAEAASREIGGWVEGQTNGKIKDLIPLQLLNTLTRLALPMRSTSRAAGYSRFRNGTHGRKTSRSRARRR